MAKLLLKSKIKKIKNTDKKQVAIVGYSGASVDLKDMGIEEPLVYNLDGFSVHNNIPYYEEHNTLIGHTIENRKEDGELITVAEHSVDNDSSKSVYNAIQNGESYEASMGVEIDLEHVLFINSGTVEVNKQTFQAPLYVANKGTVTEMTATKSGRDSNTSIHKLSQEYEEGKDLLMKIKNSRLKVTNSDPSQEYLEGYKEHEFGKLLIDNAKKDKWDEDKFKEELVKLENAKKPDPPQDFMYLLGYIDDPIGKTLIQNARTNKWDEDAFKAEIKKVEIENAKKLLDHKDPTYDPSFLFDYVDHPIGKTLLKNARENKWDKERIDREIEIIQLKNSHPSIPGIHVKGGEDADTMFTARLANSLGVSNETIEKKLGKKAAESVDNNNTMGLKEGLMIAANSNGGRFNGHSDDRALSKHVKGLVVHNSFSTIDYPNLMHRVSDWKMEELWLAEAPQSPELCMEVKAKDFREQGRIKARGGKMWEGLSQEGKISHGAHGKEDTYTTKLNTVAQILTFKREDIINDDIGWIEDTLTLMLEGALMVPDYMFVNLWYTAASSGVLTGTGASFLVLNATNLGILYDAIRIHENEKTAPVNDKVINSRFNTRWQLVVPPALEETAWDIIKQDRIVQDDVKGALGAVGDKNYWFNRFDIKVFDNLDNTTYNANALSTSWGLLPTTPRYRPFYISYLGSARRPTTENVDLPADELGFGVRGFWDVNEGFRPVENDLLQATAISTGAGS